MTLRFKRNNSGAALYLHEDDLVLAQATPLFHDGKMIYTRTHVEISGYAERAVYTYLKDGTDFLHRETHLSPSMLDEIRQLFRELASLFGKTDIPQDPSSDIRSLRFWYEGDRLSLALPSSFDAELTVEKRSGFDRAWDVIQSVFA